MNINDLKQSFEEYRSILQRYVSRLVGSDKSEDICQETFYRALKSIDTFKNKCSIKNWIFRIAGNLAIDMIRENRRRGCSPFTPDSISSDDIDSAHAFSDIIDERPWTCPQDRLDRLEMMECIAEFIDQLQPTFKKIILLREFEHLEFSDIEDIEGISSENARVRLYRAKESLKKALSIGCHIYQGRVGNLACERK